MVPGPGTREDAIPGRATWRETAPQDRGPTCRGYQYPPCPETPTQPRAQRMRWCTDPSVTHSLRAGHSAGQVPCKHRRYSDGRTKRGDGQGTVSLSLVPAENNTQQPGFHLLLRWPVSIPNAHTAVLPLGQ